MTDIVKQNNSTAVANSELPVSIEQLAAMSGLGLQNATADDYALPFLGILQKMSKQVDEAEVDLYIPGAKPGMFLNASTKQIFDGAAGIKVVPVEFSKVWNLWVPRNAGGGFKGTFTSEAEAQKARGSNPWDIVDTANHYLLVEVGENQWEPMIFSCTSTKLKQSRQWNSLMGRQTVQSNGINIPLATFAKSYTLKTISQKNEKGTYSNFAASVNEGYVSASVFNQAMDFRAQLESGKAKVNFENSAESVSEVEDDSEVTY